MPEAQRNYVEVEMNELPLSFEEELILCEKELDFATEDYKHRVFVDDENVTDAFLHRKMTDLEKKYIDLVCEANEKEYSWWIDETVDRLMCGVITNRENDNPVQSEKLMAVFELYRRAKATRKEQGKDF